MMLVLPPFHQKVNFEEEEEEVDRILITFLYRSPLSN
jgi:hypothetical protein